MRLSDYPEPEVEVWDEHWDAVMLFSDNMTQWRTGPAGIIGMDYAVFHRYFERNGFDGDKEEWYMNRIRVMEARMLSPKT